MVEEFDGDNAMNVSWVWGPLCQCIGLNPLDPEIYVSAARRLGVPAPLIGEHGSDSPEVAEAMAEAARKMLSADIGLSTTGILTGSVSEQQRPGLTYIGIADATTDLIPGHVHLGALCRQVERGIHSGGGQAFRFGLPGVCDGIVMGHAGMHYSLPSRELIADLTESIVNGVRARSR